ncbi:hypothetical protein SCBWM1_gp24 [Synechococcus phage S-CBWM1]|uniref:Uncharacterized protein n=1 Tax=Synechococcus phage S-CBWM1 TaxID=2053653 RepID=A0A3G1L3F0_9CAUD|nr:hypothetical protein HOU61_gp173 [Synechococcus phage S-CBWM1]ATW62708.1 hypothetical protein SCBWM1_gp24 [Synechococcus phage S-CBWM1]
MEPLYQIYLGWRVFFSTALSDWGHIVWGLKDEESIFYENGIPLTGEAAEEARLKYFWEWL